MHKIRLYFWKLNDFWQSYEGLSLEYCKRNIKNYVSAAIPRMKFPLMDTLNPLQLFVEKCQFFQSKEPMTKWYYISLNREFTVILNSIICFSVQFCDNSLLVLKMHLQVFSFASKKVQGFSSDMKMLMLLLSVFFHLQKCVSVFWNFNF